MKVSSRQHKQWFNDRSSGEIMLAKSVIYNRPEGFGS